MAQVTLQSRRKSTKRDFSVITKKEPEKSLLAKYVYKAGRSHGKISTRHKGGRGKRLYRVIDFKRDKRDVKAKVIAIEYSPFHSAYLALLQYPDGQKRYILAPEGLKVDAEVIASDKEVPLQPGNATKLKNLPVGTVVHAVELIPGRGAQIARAAGTSAVILAHDENKVHLKMPSTEIRVVNANCFASIGQTSNVEWANILWGKAGRSRHLGIRPTVRGKAMNPVDHPHGGGEGRSPVGLKYSKTPWGKPAKGVKTRKRKHTDKFILKRRKK